MNTIARKSIPFMQIGLMLLLLFIGGCSTSPDRAIERILNECAEVTAEVNKSNMSAAQSADYIASRFQKMDTRNCPPEFRVAFQHHINAWREASVYLAQNTPLNSFLEGFAAGILQDPSLLGESQRNAVIAVNNINQTYYQLVLIAAAYGARVPESIVR
jgi:hypothetical protein